MRCASVLAILPLALGAAAPSPPAVSAETPVATLGDIVFVSGQRGARVLYVMNPSGKNVHRVLAEQRGRDGGRSPSWSPDVFFGKPSNGFLTGHLVRQPRGHNGHARGSFGFAPVRSDAWIACK